MSVGEAERNGRSMIIACRVMEPELAHLLSEKNGEDDQTDILYLEQALHRTPAKLLGLLQEKIDQVARTASRIVLGYGLCAKGIVGITAGETELIIPRCHDCIALFLGSPNRHLEIFREKTGDLLPDAGLGCGKEGSPGDNRGASPPVRPGDGQVGHRGGAEALHPYRPDRYGGGGNGAAPCAGEGERRRSEESSMRRSRAASITSANSSAAPMRRKNSCASGLERHSPWRWSFSRLLKNARLLRSLILRHCGVRKSTPHSSGHRRPRIRPF